MVILDGSSRPVRGADLASRLAVSRQVIVQDVAVLRAGGADIIATPQGYVLPKLAPRHTFREIIACQHQPERIEEELTILVDLGIRVLDVTVEHPVYGDLRGLLMVESREDVRMFLQRLAEGQAQPLSALTRGVHLHTIEGRSPEMLDKARRELRTRGILLEERDGEGTAT